MIGAVGAGICIVECDDSGCCEGDENFVSLGS